MTKLNKFQQRIKDNPNGGGRYMFFGVPKNEEGKKWIKDAKQYLNTDLYTMKSPRGRASISYAHSINQKQADSFCIYIEEKPKLKKFELTYCISSYKTEVKEFESIGDAEDYANSKSIIDYAYTIKEIE